MASPLVEIKRPPMRSTRPLVDVRNLIMVGEEMVSVAYDSDVEMTPNRQIEKVEGELFQLAEKGRYDGGFQNFSSALSASITSARPMPCRPPSSSPKKRPSTPRNWRRAS